MVNLRKMKRNCNYLFLLESFTSKDVSLQFFAERKQAKLASFKETSPSIYQIDPNSSNQSFEEPISDSSTSYNDTNGELHSERTQNTKESNELPSTNTTRTMSSSPEKKIPPMENFLFEFSIPGYNFKPYLEYSELSSGN